MKNQDKLLTAEEYGRLTRKLARPTAPKGKQPGEPTDGEILAQLADCLAGFHRKEKTRAVLAHDLRQLAARLEVKEPAAG